MKIKNSLSQIDWIVILRFLICGGVTTVLDFTVYRCLIEGIGPLTAKSISFCFGAVLSFFLNRRWTFRAQSTISGPLILKFAVTQGVNLATNSGTNYIILQITHHLICAFICATGCGMVVNFILQRFWVFSPNHKKS